MIRVRRENPGGKRLPLLDALLETSDPEERILQDMITFLGGFHTVTYYVTWVFYFLAQHSDIQEKIMKEVRQKVGSCCGDRLKAYVLSSSSYLRQVLDEALRLSTTVPFSAHYSDKGRQTDGIHGLFLHASFQVQIYLGQTFQDSSISLHLLMLHRLHG